MTRSTNMSSKILDRCCNICGVASTTFCIIFLHLQGLGLTKFLPVLIYCFLIGILI